VSAAAQRPRIGVTGPDDGGRAAWWFTRFALWRAGARSRRITPSRPVGGAEIDGLVLGGGADVAPRLYGMAAPSLTEVMEEGREEEGHGFGRRLVSLLTLVLRRLSARKAAVAAVDPARDELEVRLLEQTLADGKPVLGICRGAQLLNVHLGGTLHRDLASFYEETPQVRTVRPKKKIAIEPGSLLAEILRTDSCRVNSLHHQAVDRLAPSLRVVARETTGVVQAIEDPGRRFLLGVQWHPEYLPQSRRQRRVFGYLAAAARRPGIAPEVGPDDLGAESVVSPAEDGSPFKLQSYSTHSISGASPASSACRRSTE
jgi:putative glutamine amidotransferase